MEEPTSTRLRLVFDINDDHQDCASRLCKEILQICSFDIKLARDYFFGYVVPDLKRDRKGAAEDLQWRFNWTILRKVVKDLRFRQEVSLFLAENFNRIAEEQIQARKEKIINQARRDLTRHLYSALQDSLVRQP